MTVTLDVSYGTFQPVFDEDLSRHAMFEEDYEISAEACETINRAVREGRRVIACGTTSVRTLESAADENGFVRAGKGATRIFIYPPYRFRTVTGLITNFHLPKSSLLMLVAAFLDHQDVPPAGLRRLLNFYQDAVFQGYRFFSYGDAMLIL